MAALKLLSVSLLAATLALLLVMLVELLLSGRYGIWQRLQTFYLRMWCACPSTWLCALLARLGRTQ